MKHNIYFIIILISALFQGQNLIIQNGQFNDAYDIDIIKDISIGNVCEQEFFLNLYYNGDMYLKGDVYINHSILTVYGNLHKGNNNIYLKCDRSDLIVDNYLSINTNNLYSCDLYPNPTKDVFYIYTDKPYKIRVYDIKGKHLTDFPNLRGFPKGIYLVEVNVDSNKFIKKVIKA